MATTIASTDVGGTGLSTVGTNGQVLTSNGTTLSWVTPSASSLTGTLGVANGGTGLTSLTAGYIPFGNGTSAFGSDSSFTWNTSSKYLFVNSTASTGIDTGVQTVTITGVTGGNGGTLGLVSDSVGRNIVLTDSGKTKVATYSISSTIANIGTNTSTPFAFNTNAVERMRISSNGFVGIANASPTTYLDVNPDNISYSYGAYVRAGRNASGTGQAIVSFEETASSSSEDFNLVATSTSYTNASTNGWGQYRILCNTNRTTVYNHATFIAGSNAVNFYFRADGNAYAHATWNSNGVDYAEYFESVDGSEIPVGTTVVLNNGKIRASVKNDPPETILEIVRPKINAKGPSLVGGGNTTEWKDRYLTDDYGRYVMEPYSTYEWDEEITDADGNVSTKHHDYVSDAIPEGIIVPPNTPLKTEQADGTPLIRQKLNPDYDKNHTYVSREKRPEWHIIGLLGQIPMTKGQIVGDRWIKLNDISKTVEMWFVK